MQRGEAPAVTVTYSRADVLQAGGTLAGVLGGMGLGMQGVRAVEEAEKIESSTLVPFVSTSKVFSFEYPDSWKLAPKPLQTHQEEVGHVWAGRKRKENANSPCPALAIHAYH